MICVPNWATDSEPGARELIREGKVLDDVAAGEGKQA